MKFGVGFMWVFWLHENGHNFLIWTRIDPIPDPMGSYGYGAQLRPKESVLKCP